MSRNLLSTWRCKFFSVSLKIIARETELALQKKNIKGMFMPSDYPTNHYSFGLKQCSGSLRVKQFIFG